MYFHITDIFMIWINYLMLIMISKNYNKNVADCWGRDG